MNSRKMRNRITIQKQLKETSENGFESDSWEDIKTLWAGVNNLFGKEYYEAAAINRENTVKFFIRYMKDLDSSMRVIFKGKYYNIKSIDNIRYENKYMEIKAVEESYVKD